MYRYATGWVRAFLFVFATIAILVSGSTTAIAQRTDYGPALTFTGTRFGSGFAEGNFGWTFSVVEPGFIINRMGVWDVDADGLVNSHEVGLWQGTTLIATTTVGPTSTLTLDNGTDLWRVNEIPSLLLTPGDYTLAAHYLGGDMDDFVAPANGIATIPELVYGTAVQSGFSGIITTLELETLAPDTGRTPGFFGPIIGHVSATAPEPGTLALVGLGLLGGVLGRCRQSFLRSFGRPQLGRLK
ncbi:MAG: PEP-CTERM sorting domain-containing protein [Capsulimonadales bacterium]|nr:PEP-CTERM sorting domain-containing protein [Capsulimonadales bacterium]